MSDRILDERRRGLEEAFFAAENERLLRRLRDDSAREDRVAALQAAAGTQDRALLETLAAMGLTAETLGALTLAPLVLVAWADGSVKPEERAAVLRAAGEAGVADGSAARQLLDAWLAAQPPASLATAWRGYVEALTGPMSPETRAALRHATLDRARRVAEAAGGFLGLGGAISSAERRVLEDLGHAFG